ncbi:ABC transporter permease [Limosilactobacillus difficilis]|uniref:ABC transporter permease n=1 Tax=Limosilactobacillus difficilis TaxID=2991838 RepID=UPI0024B946B0|nr:ABC transporter permease [Limosilactobacillus difficilis]
MQLSKEKNKFSMKRFAQQNSALIAFVILFVVSVLIKGKTFLNLGNIISVLQNNATIGIISLGMMLIIITAGMDLSVGSMLAALGLIGLAVLNHTNSILLAFLACILAGAIFGLITGAFVAQFTIPAFIVTLGTMRIYRSLAEYACQGGGITATVSHADKFINISNSSVIGIPIPVIIWAVLGLVIWVVANKTAFGRHVYAVGSNQKATFLSGINVKRVLVFVYIIGGMLVAVASMLEASRLGSINSASSGLNYEMDAIAATVIGGTDLFGGKGTVSGTIFGTLTLGIINNLMNLLGMPSFLVGAVKGAIIIIAVLMQRAFNSQSENVSTN